MAGQRAASLAALLVLLALRVAAAARGAADAHARSASGDASAHSASAPLASASPEVDALQARAAKASLYGLEKKGSATLSRATAAAASASSAANRAQYLSALGELKKAKLKDMLAASTAAGDRAVQFEKEATRSRKELESVSKSATDQAAQLAVKAVQDMFKSKYRKLESWRRKVLTDPYAKAQNAVVRAAKPYDRELSAAYARASEFTAQAAELKSQAKELEKEVAALRHQAQDEAKTNPVGAKQDFADARRFEAKAYKLSKEAKAASVSAKSIAADAEKTLKERRKAALRAAQEANPESLLPLRVDPDTAYAPP